MPRAQTDQERLLAFAFRATPAELEEARRTIDAALRAKRGGGTKKTSTRSRPPKPAVDKADETEG